MFLVGTANIIAKKISLFKQQTQKNHRILTKNHRIFIKTPNFMQNWIFKSHIKFNLENLLLDS
ncbi:hypothetical protein CCY99_03190 [Helicobacter sp. 16-1353]|nr:hypothetical protein CCY99_03190 [Helicobacter sp. 16-1353]